MVVAITGGNGQLGSCLQEISKKYPQFSFVFCDVDTLDITNIEQVEQFFIEQKPNFIINAAAYTAVDKAETEIEKAQQINVLGAENLAKMCTKYHSVIVHISTDFVFDGLKTEPYTELDTPNPLGVYGKTKLEGERAITKNCTNHYIIRTAWLYSAYGANFMKTMLRLGAEKPFLTVVSDQIGTPTHALDLAEALLTIIQKTIAEPENNRFGLYHYSNLGQCSWFDFAQKILELNNCPTPVKPIPSTDFPTPAKRPTYSVMDKTKIIHTFNIAIPTWEDSLKKCLTGLK